MLPISRTAMGMAMTTIPGRMNIPLGTRISRKRDNRTDFARLGGTLTLQRRDVQ